MRFGTASLSDLDILSVGNTVQLVGAIYSGEGWVYLLPLPGEEVGELHDWPIKVLEMDSGEWERFLQQTDVLDVRGPNKAILRKSQRMVDQAIAWEVYERDGYVCRYCGRKKPLTVDHVILWEEEGATVGANLVSCCRRCNKLRGSVPYDEWLRSDDYQSVAKGLTSEAYVRNLDLVGKLEDLRKIKAKPRSR